MYISLLIIETCKTFVVTYYTIWFSLELSNCRNVPTIWFKPSQNSLFSNRKKMSYNLVQIKTYTLQIVGIFLQFDSVHIFKIVGIFLQIVSIHI